MPEQGRGVCEPELRTEEKTTAAEKVKLGHGSRREM